MFVIAHGICGDIEFSEANKLYSKMVQHFAKCCRCVFFFGLRCGGGHIRCCSLGRFSGEQLLNAVCAIERIMPHGYGI